MMSRASSAGDTIACFLVGSHDSQTPAYERDCGSANQRTSRCWVGRSAIASASVRQTSASPGSGRMQGAAWDARASGVAVAAPASSVTLPLDWRARCAAKVPPRRGEVGTRSCTRPEERCATNSGAGAPREWLGGPAFDADVPRQQPPPPIACPRRMLTRSPLHRHTAITMRAPKSHASTRVTRHGIEL
jgi:hypothetical protein